MLRRSERRESPRVEWNTPARIRLQGRSDTVPCVVHNLSNTGARITAPNILTLPNEFILELSRGAEGARNCCVVWRTKSELGVEFVADAPAASKAPPRRSQAALATG